MDLRPRGSAELVDVSVRLLRRHHAQLAMMSAMGAVPLVIALSLVGRSGRAAGGAGPLTVLSALLAAAAGAWFLTVDSAIYLVAADAYHGRPPTVAGALGMVLSRIGAVLVARSLRAILSIGATVLSFFAYAFVLGTASALLRRLPVITTLSITLFLASAMGLALVLARYVSVPMALLVEGATPLGSFRRSLALARGSVPRVALTLALVWLPTAAIALGTLVALGVLDAGGWVATAVFALLFGMAQPLTRVVAVLAYYDLRIRKEGYDIEVLAASTPRPAAASATAAPSPDAARGGLAGGPGATLQGDRPAATFQA